MLEYFGPVKRREFWFVSILSHKASKQIGTFGQNVTFCQILGAADVTNAKNVKGSVGISNYGGFAFVSYTTWTESY